MGYGRIQIRKEKRGAWDVFVLSEAITEDAGVHLVSLYDAAGPKCIFNMKDVTALNSSGIRSWIMFLRDFQEGREIQLEECSPVVVAQINMLPSFLQKTKLMSIYVPYVCDSCGHEQNELVPGPKYPATNEEAKPARCKQCQKQSFVSDEDEFFAFTAQR